MSELFSQLGIDWRLFISQAANFLLLLIVLRVFTYKPILKILKDRKMKIEDGILKAKEAESRLHEANEMAMHRMKSAEIEAHDILKKGEERAKNKEAEMMLNVQEKEKALIANTERIIEAKAAEARREMQREAAVLVKEALIKTVELDPKKVDESLIKEALAGLQNAK